MTRPKLVYLNPKWKKPDQVEPEEPEEPEEPPVEHHSPGLWVGVLVGFALGFAIVFLWG